MLNLTAGDVTVIAEIAARRTETAQQRDQMVHTLVRGFEKYGDEDLIRQCGGRENLFRQRSDWLVENMEYAGRKSEDVFASEQGRASLERTLRSINVAASHIPDLVQDITIKFWKHQLAEKYNPCKAPWGHFYKNAVRTCVYTFWSSRQRNVLEVASYKSATGEIRSSPTVALNQHRARSREGSEDLSLDPYEDAINQDPHCEIVLREFLQEFEEFLSQEKPFRSSLDRGCREVCVLLAPGIPSYRITEDKELHVRSKGGTNFRVEDPEEGESQSFLVPVSLLKDLKPGLTERDRKVRLNPNFDENSTPVRLERKPLDVYNLLIRGSQIEEIAQELRVGPSTAHNWVKRLEVLFAEYWTISDVIPDSLRWQGYEHYECPECSRYTPVSEAGDRCSCNTPFSKAERVIPLRVFPWDRVRGTADIKERERKYSSYMMVKTASI